MNKFKEGDAVQRVHKVEGIFPNGKYKIVSGQQNFVVDEKELMPIITKRSPLTVEFLAIMGIAGAFFFNNPYILFFFGFIIAFVTDK